jgi:Tol biopolymer transport system component
VAFLRQFYERVDEGIHYDFELVRQAILTVNADGSDEREIQDWPVSREAPLLSPDGRELAFTQPTDVSGNSNTRQLFKIGIDGRGPVQLTHLQNAYGDLVSWSPDGSQLLYERRLSITSGVVDRVRSDGSAQSTILSQGDGFGSIVWSPDGKKLALTRDGDVFVLGADGTSPTNVTNTSGVRELVTDWQAVSGPKRSA